MQRFLTVFFSRRLLASILACFILLFLSGSVVAIPFSGQKVTELVIIDADIADSDILSSHVNAQTAIVFLDKGIEKLTQDLNQYHHLQALHIVSHGRPGSLKIGTNVLSMDHLYSEQLLSWRKALEPGADVLLYGCNVAQGSEGVEFIGQLSQLLQADVAASSDLTGKGGNWTLEQFTGHIETTIAFSADSLASYPGVLKQIAVTTTLDGGTGSLRWAINQANETPEDDLIDLKQVSGTIKLRESLPKITSSMTIAGNGDDIISGNNTHQVMYIDKGEVTIRDLTIADGLAIGNDGNNGAGGAAGMGGGIFINGGTVTLSSVKFLTSSHAVNGGDSLKTDLTVLP